MTTVAVRRHQFLCQLWAEDNEEFKCQSRTVLADAFEASRNAPIPTVTWPIGTGKRPSTPGEDATINQLSSSDKTTHNVEHNDYRNCTGGSSASTDSHTPRPLLGGEQPLDDHPSCRYRASPESLSNTRVNLEISNFSTTLSLHYPSGSLSSASSSPTPGFAISTMTPNMLRTPYLSLNYPSDSEHRYGDKKEGVHEAQKDKDVGRCANCLLSSILQETRWEEVGIELQQLGIGGEENRSNEAAEAVSIGTREVKILRWWSENIAVTVPGERARDHLALERTYFSYHRLSLIFAISASACAQLQILQNKLRKTSSGASALPSQGSTWSRYDDLIGKNLSIVFCCAAIVVSFVGWWRWWRWQNALLRGKGVAGGWEVSSLAAAILLLGCVGFGVTMRGLFGGV